MKEMRDNVFLENKKELELADFMNYADGSRGNLGKEHSGDNIPTAGVFHPGTADPPVWKGNTDSGLFQDAGFRAEIKE